MPGHAYMLIDYRVHDKKNEVFRSLCKDTRLKFRSKSLCHLGCITKVTLQIGRMSTLISLTLFPVPQQGANKVLLPLDSLGRCLIDGVKESLHTLKK